MLSVGPRYSTDDHPDRAAYPNFPLLQFDEVI